MKKLKIVSISSELSPFSKSGGLADVARSLPKALSRLKHSIIAITPLYGKIIDKKKYNLQLIFKNIPVVLGGIEASLRRIPHYDFWSDKLRNSILFDSKADILVYGMGEKAILSIADLLSEGKSIKGITDVPGTVVPIKIPDKEGLILPEYTKQISKGTFHEFNVLFDKNFQNKTIYQKCLGRYLRHNPPQKSLTTKRNSTYLL